MKEQINFSDYHKVSIIIPTYNEENFLNKCLNSISMLDYPKNNIEVIVVDNGSTDRTLDIAAAHKTKILKDSTKNVSGLRNLGAQNATGNILAFVDADCIVSPDWLVKSQYYFENCEVAAWGGSPVPPKGASWVQSSWFLLVKNSHEVEYVDWIGTIDFFVNKSTFHDIGGFNEELVTCEDVDFCYRVSKYGRIVSDDRIKVVHLREADTIGEFYKKELWRGKANLRGVLSHGLFLKELPSLLIPVYFGAFLPICIILSLFFLNPSYYFLMGLLFFIPGIITMLKVRKKKADLLTRCQLFLLVYVYFFARTVTIISNK